MFETDVYRGLDENVVGLRKLSIPVFHPDDVFSGEGPDKMHGRALISASIALGNFISGVRTSIRCGVARHARQRFVIGWLAADFTSASRMW